ncbi:MAG: mechanosensitive ion channel, partial [Thermoplasmata archaeon]|nr:mechanosensitive ion channel [Thermoplasmata archaeon]
MRRKSWLLAIILAICLFSTFLMIYPVVAQEPPVVETTDFKTFISYYDESTNDFAKYNPGDRIKIADEIERLKYNEEDDITKIWFKSEDDLYTVSKFITIWDNAESKFKKGEDVEIIVTIGLDEFGNETYTTSLSDMIHVTKIDEDEEKHGIDLLGFHFEFPEQLKVLDNNFGRFLVQFIIWLIIASIVLVILDPIIRRATKKSVSKIDDIILDIIRRPVLILIILYGVVVSLRELELPTEFMYWVEGAYSIGFFLMMIWIGFRVFQGILIQVGHSLTKRTGYKVDKILVPFIQKIALVIVGLVVLITILGYLQIDLTLFAVGGVVISMVIAFAAQDTLSNFFAGMFLILEPKFKEDDMIFFEGDTYLVRKIGMRTTQLYDLFKHIDVIMPNNKLANEKLVNITEPDRRIKDTCEVGVAYGSDPKRVHKLLLEVVSKHPDIINDDLDRKPFTRFTEFGDSSINFKVGFWVRDLDDRFRV